MITPINFGSSSIVYILNLVNQHNLYNISLVTLYQGISSQALNKFSGLCPFLFRSFYEAVVIFNGDYIKIIQDFQAE